ncbi:MAG: ABC transporter permease [Deltaproteobacteria bacterium]|nr:ABC transporter permease [Deltaproteobacteria bacterium]
MRRNLLQALAVIVILAAVHVGIGLAPTPPFSLGVNLALFFTNLFLFYAAAAVLRRRPARTVVLFVAGYTVLFLLVLAILNKPSLFILLAVAYAGFFGAPVLLGFFAIFVACFVLFQPFAFETIIPLSLIYAVFWLTRRRASLFVRLCLCLGLLALTVVLFPLIHLAMQDSLQTLWRTFMRGDVASAIWLSLLTSTLATAFLAAWAVPLAYALARVDFPGKRWALAMIDVPILVPQSVAGVALIVLLGPGSVLGGALASLGLPISGSLFGIVIAQVFVASPFLVKTAMTAFEAVPLQYEFTSRSLGASPAATFARISVPLASRGILVGATLAWARAVSEFGCIVLFASSPVTAPVLVHTEFLRAGASESRPIAILLLVICLWVFVMLQFGQTLMPFAMRRPGGEKRP